MADVALSYELWRNGGVGDGTGGVPAAKECRRGMRSGDDDGGGEMWASGVGGGGGDEKRGRESGGRKKGVWLGSGVRPSGGVDESGRAPEVETRLERVCLRLRG